MLSFKGIQMSTTPSGNKESNDNNSIINNNDTKKEKIVHKFKAGECSIQSVTVYNDRAEITRSVVADLKGNILTLSLFCLLSGPSPSSSSILPPALLHGMLIVPLYPLSFPATCPASRGATLAFCLYSFI